jgi:thioredoxin reductase (NADPH)
MSDQTKNDGVEKVVIIGSGPAGWTAALYAARANLSPLVCEGIPKQEGGYVLPGGQLMLTTEVENYPGFVHGIGGPQMMAVFKEQAERFGARVLNADVLRCDFSKKPFELHIVDTDGKDRVLKTHAVIIATGATANWLNLANEQRLALSGGGVSACAVCDGALPAFRNQELAVVGGGDTAIEEASYLAKFGSKVHIIHRRDSFRASKAMQDRVTKAKNINVIWNSSVVDVHGEKAVEAVQLKDTQTGAESKLPVKGLFIAIGHTPATRFLAGSGIELDDKGYVKLPDGGRAMTNIEGVFAAGDVSDSVYRQAVTAAGMGCRAAIDAERWLASKDIH